MRQNHWLGDTTKAMPNQKQLDRLAVVIANDAQSAFTQLLTKAGNERPYGFAIYTDDSACGLDAAVNTQEGLSRKVAAPRADKFAAYWYTIEWGYEGGVALCFKESTRML